MIQTHCVNSFVGSILNYQMAFALAHGLGPRLMTRCNHERLAILAQRHGRPFPDRLTSRSGLHPIAYPHLWRVASGGAVMTLAQYIVIACSQPQKPITLAGPRVNKS